MIAEFNNLLAEKFTLINPFFIGRKRDVNNVDTVVLHWAASTNLKSVVNVLHRKRFGYHFLIDFDGNVYQGAPVEKVTSHAGSSYGPRGNFVNRHSIGISFLVSGVKGSGEFTEEMYESCVNLIKDIKIKLPNIKYITGHHWISPGRKIDPYTLDFNKVMNKLGPDYTIWKTEYAPFPDGLSDCKCHKYDDNGNCIQSSGDCIGAGKQRYSRRRLSNEINNISFQLDTDTE